MWPPILQDYCDKERFSTLDGFVINRTPLILVCAKNPKPSNVSGRVGARLPFQNTYQKGIYPFLEQARYYVPDENVVCFGGQIHSQRSHTH